MLSTDAAQKLRVYVRNTKGEPKRFGKVHSMVFHPTQLRAIGYQVKRPDALLMVKRKDRFVAIDRLEAIDGGICVVDAPDSWDDKACKRLGVDFDECVIWEYMPVRTESGRELGIIKSVFIDEDDYSIQSIDVSTSAASRVLLGDSLVQASQIIGYEDGAIVIKDFEGDIEENGGVAARAGEAWAKTKHTASAKAQEAGEAINDGAYRAGEAIGAVRDEASEVMQRRKEKKRVAEENGEYTGVDKAANLLGQQLGKTKGMFQSFKEEFDKASKDD